jgi:DNA polymerase II large subunit
MKQPKAKPIRVPVQCNECGKKFKVANLDGRCPKCRGCDFEPTFERQ